MKRTKATRACWITTQFDFAKQPGASGDVRKKSPSSNARCIASRGSRDIKRKRTERRLLTRRGESDRNAKSLTDVRRSMQVGKLPSMQRVNTSMKCCKVRCTTSMPRVFLLLRAGGQHLEHHCRKVTGGIDRDVTNVSAIEKKRRNDREDESR